MIDLQFICRKLPENIILPDAFQWKTTNSTFYTEKLILHCTMCFTLGVKKYFALKTATDVLLPSFQELPYYSILVYIT